jgi:hypothetical protein
MRLKISDIDLRSVASGGSQPVIDEDTGGRVGRFYYGKQIGRAIYLFGNKYIGRFETQAECVAFLKGVEAVLNHMVSMDRKQPPSFDGNDDD